MSEKKKDGPKEEGFDRLEYMRQIRRECLENLDLPVDTKPDRVLQLVKIKEEMARIRKNSGKNH
ncbi:MAG: hypothetical protein LBS60_02260 [Deltaproteobacteria bacterium]|jgi:hypothetical protein|nr:hypothetical protein [Deltaproteobacteria bacterium]